MSPYIREVHPSICPHSDSLVAWTGWTRNDNNESRQRRNKVLSELTAPESGASIKLILAGPAGAGKSTLLQALIERLGWQPIEADDFHTEDARLEMVAGGTPDDAYRFAWIGWIAEAVQAHEGHVIATCSALKRRYRDHLRSLLPEVRIVYLDLDRNGARTRVSQRPGHWFKANAVDRQHDTIEHPGGEPDTLVVDAMLTADEIVELIVGWVNAR